MNTLIASPYHTFEIRIDQPCGYVHLFNYWDNKSAFGGSFLFMIRTVSGLNKNEFHLTQDIALEIYENSFRIENEILDMDKTWNKNGKLNSLYSPNSKPDESLGTSVEGYDECSESDEDVNECEQTWENALNRLLKMIKYSSLSNQTERLVSFVIAHQLLPRQIPYNILCFIKYHHRYIEYVNSNVNGNTSESGVIEDDGKKNRNLNE